jgi:hypothetical protein
MMARYGLHSSGSEQRQGEGTCKHGNELCSIKCWVNIWLAEQLADSQERLGSIQFVSSVALWVKNLTGEIPWFTILNVSLTLIVTSESADSSKAFICASELKLLQNHNKMGHRRAVWCHGIEPGQYMSVRNGTRDTWDWHSCCWVGKSSSYKPIDITWVKTGLRNVSTVLVSAYWKLLRCTPIQEYSGPYLSLLQQQNSLCMYDSVTERERQRERDRQT